MDDLTEALTKALSFAKRRPNRKLLQNTGLRKFSLITAPGTWDSNDVLRVLQ